MDNARPLERRSLLSTVVGCICLLLWLTATYTEATHVTQVAEAFGPSTTFPPGFAGRADLYMWTAFGFIMTLLFSTGWIWELVWTMIDRPAPARHPLTIERTVKLLLITALLCAEAPRATLVLFWPETSPDTRIIIAEVTYHMAGFSFILLFSAWLLDQMTGKLIDSQLSRYVPDISLRPGRDKFTKLLWCAPLVLIASVFLTYLRP